MKTKKKMHDRLDGSQEGFLEDGKLSKVAPKYFVINREDIHC
jgi:hypothetical protein